MAPPREARVREIGSDNLFAHPGVRQEYGIELFEQDVLKLQREKCTEFQSERQTNEFSA